MEQTSIKRNAVLNTIKNLSSILFPLITFPYISRVLLIENIGKINFGSSIVSYFSLIASLGITTYAIRECSAVCKDRQAVGDTASQIYSINILTTAVAYILLAVTLFFSHRLVPYRGLIILQSLSILASTAGTEWLNLAMEDFKFITIRTVAFQVISLVLMFIFVRRESDYVFYVIITLISSAGASISNIWYRKKYCDVKFIRKIKSGIDWRKHITPIMYLFVMILAQTIFSSADSTMLGIIHGDREVGIYGTAHKIQSIVMQVVASMAWVFMPRMSLYFSMNDLKKVNELAEKIFGYFCLIGLPCVAGMLFLSKEIILISAGSSFADAAPVLQILAIGFLFSLFGGGFLGNIILLPAKREKTFMLLCSISAFINVMTNCFLIPEMGAAGAAVTTCICEAVMMICLIFAVKKQISLKGAKSFIVTPVIGCIGIFLVCGMSSRVSSLWLRTSVSIGASVLVYALVQLYGKNALFMELINKGLETVKRDK